MIPVRSTLFFVAVSTLTALVASLLWGSLTTEIAIISLFIGGFCALLLAPSETEGGFDKSLNTGFFSVLTALFLAATVLFHGLYLVYENDHWIWTLHKNNFGDLGLHIGMIRNLASSVPFPPTNPIFFEQALTYPYGVNLFNALFEKLGVPTFVHLRLAFWGFSGLLLVQLFRLGGGPMALAFFAGASSWSLFAGPEIQWKNFFLSLWITQRGLLFAIPLGLLLFHEMLYSLKGSTDKTRELIGLNSGFLLGALAFFHLHSFVALFLLIAGFTFIYQRSWKSLALAFFIAAPFVLNSTDFFTKASVVHISWGWMLENPLDFLRNLGLWPIFFLGFMGWLFWKNDPLRWGALWGALCGLVFFNLMLAPWEWDNMKVLIWPFLLLSAIVFQSRWLPVTGKWLVSLILSFLGISELFLSWPSQSEAVKLVSVEELNDWEVVLEGVSKQAPIAISPTFNHPIALLGHQVVMGYPGHLWSHGISYQKLEGRLLRSYNTGEPIEGLQLFAWGTREKEKFEGSMRIPGEIREHGKAILVDLDSDR